MKNCGAEGIAGMICQTLPNDCYAQIHFLDQESSLKVKNKTAAISLGESHLKEAQRSDMRGCLKITQVIAGIKREIAQNKTLKS